MRNFRVIKPRLTFLIIIIFLSLLVYFLIIRPQQLNYYAKHVNINGTYLIKPLPIQDFTVTDNYGKKFTLNNFRNHWTFLYFGFTNCPMACPTTLKGLNGMMLRLKKILIKEKLPQVVFFTVDPERDTLNRLNKYIKTINPEFIAVRTNPEKTAELIKQFHIIADKLSDNTPNSSYTINHSTSILLINPEAKIQAYFAYPPNEVKMAQNYMEILRKTSLM